MGLLNKSSLSKDIKEAAKTLSYLARAEKYFDLELMKNGQITKPLLKISDYIDPLRKISDAVAQIEKGNVPEASAKQYFARTNEIIELCNDILKVNPRGLVANDKKILVNLGNKITEAKMLYTASRTQFDEEPTLVQKKPTATVQRQQIAQPIEAPRQYSAPVQEAIQAKAPEPEAPQPILQPISYSQFQDNRPEVTYEYKNIEFEVETPVELEKPKVVPIAKTKKEKTSDKSEKVLFKEKYFATSYAGMNLQEAASIIEELGRDSDNLSLVLIEHASEVRPVALGLEIADDLRALAPIADAFESGQEVENKKSLTILKEAERIITIVRDIASLSIDGFDKRKQKLLDRFIPHDLGNMTEFAKDAYPEIFSATDLTGDVVAPVFYDFSDVVQKYADDLDDELFTSALSQIIVQIAQYSEFNSLKYKFDVISKKIKLNSKTRKVESRLEQAYLKAVTFVPQIARQGQEISSTIKLTLEEKDVIKRALELMQLTYIHARENYSEEIREFFKAA